MLNGFLRKASESRPFDTAHKVCPMGGYHSGDMVLYRQPGEAPNMLCMNNIRLKFHNSLLDRRVKRRQILRELFAAQVGKGGRASGMGGEARKIKG